MDDNIFSSAMASVEHDDALDDENQVQPHDTVTVGKPLLSRNKARMTCRNVNVNYGDNLAIARQIAIKLGLEQPLESKSNSSTNASTA